MKNFLTLFCIVSAILLLNAHSISCFNLFNIFSNLYENREPETYRLSYFAVRARAEFIRWMFAYSRQPFIDDRINVTDWPAIKPTMPFEQVPVLEIKKNGKSLILAQSLTIGSYLADKFDLAGNNENDAALISMYAHQLSDLFNQIAAVANEDDEQAKQALTTRLFNQTWPLNLRFFETRLIRNGRNGYLVGNRYSWADLFLSELIDNIPSSRINLLENYPQVKNINLKIRSLPQIRKWIESRPITDL